MIAKPNLIFLHELKFLKLGNISDTYNTASASMAAASKMRKTSDIDSEPATAASEEIEVVVDSAKDATESMPKKKSSGMKLPPSKPKDDQDEINWDDIKSSFQEVEEEEEKEQSGNGWGEDVKIILTQITIADHQFYN